MKPAIDWSAVLFDIYRRHRSWFEISELVGCSHGSLYGWRDKAHEPRHSTGERIIALWVEVTGKPEAEAPRKTP
jgi:hypothetical protein